MQTTIKPYNDKMESTMSFRVSWVKDSRQIEYSLQTTRRSCRHWRLGVGM